MTFQQALNSKPVRILNQIWMAGVGAYAVLLMVFAPISFTLRGQTTKDELERRVAVIEGQNLEHRVTVMETVLTDLQNSVLWQRLNMGGTGLIIGEIVFRKLKRKDDSAIE